MTDWYKIKRVLVWQGWEEKQIYPAGWKPWSNTIAYWKYESNLNDSSWNNHTLSNYNSISYSTNPYAVNLTSSNYLYFNNTDTFNKDFTFNTWVYFTSRASSGSPLMSQGSWWNNHVLYAQVANNGFLWVWVFSQDYSWTIQVPLNTWTNICVSFNYSTRNIKWYVNGVKDIDATFNSSYDVPAGDFIIWWFADNPSSSYWKIQWRLSNTILEASEWDETLPSTYYNQTKSTYWL